jgi:hypothetical protein
MVAMCFLLGGWSFGRLLPLCPDLGDGGLFLAQFLTG